MNETRSKRTAVARDGWLDETSHCIDIDVIPFPASASASDSTILPIRQNGGLAPRARGADVRSNNGSIEAAGLLCCTHWPVGTVKKEV